MNSKGSDLISWGDWIVDVFCLSLLVVVHEDKVLHRPDFL